jgi:hypothetical protein
MNEYLYIIKHTQSSPKDPKGDSEKVTLYGTYTDLSAAKKVARKILEEELSLEKSFFKVFDINTGLKEWTHGDGVMAYAVAPEGEIYQVKIETGINHLGLNGNSEGKIESTLYHVLQTTVRYHDDQQGSTRSTSVEGTFLEENDAKARAMVVLLDQDIPKEHFAEFDEYEGQNDWPFGEDTLVHAVGVNGENYLVSVVKN